jgi:pilus assembly protein CpaF
MNAPDAPIEPASKDSGDGSTGTPTRESASGVPSARDRLSRSNMALPADRMPEAKKSGAARSMVPQETYPQPVVASHVEFLTVESRLHQRLLDELDRRNMLAASEETITRFIETFVDQALESTDLPLNDVERRRLVDDLLEETLGVGPLAPLMADPAVSDILVNRPDQVYVERWTIGEDRRAAARSRPLDSHHSAHRGPSGAANRRKLADGRCPVA